MEVFIACTSEFLNHYRELVEITFFLYKILHTWNESFPYGWEDLLIPDKTDIIIESSYTPGVASLHEESWLTSDSCNKCER